ncbi:MAG: hypothetical protein AB3N33_02480, partial [Puniceicoccaceae bacterium]
MPTPNLIIDHASTAFPPIGLVTRRALSAGERVFLCTASFRLFYQAELVSLKCLSPNGTEASGVTFLKLEDDKPARDVMKRSLGEVTLLQDLPAGTSIRVQLRPREDMIGTAGDIEWDLRLAVIDEEEFQANVCRFPFHDVVEPFIIRLTASPATQVQAVRRFTGELIARLCDDQGITSPTPDVQATVRVVDESCALEFGENGVARIGLDHAIKDRVLIETSEGFQTFANPLPRLDDNTNVFFGDIHWHSAYSTDGQRDLDRAMATCRDELGLDFAGPSDHILHEGDYGRSTMQDQAAVCRPFDEPGRFAVIPGFELSRRYGHCNVYTESWEQLFRIGEQFDQVFKQTLKSSKDRFFVEELMELFESETTLVIPHHSNTSNEGPGVGPDGRSIWTAFRWPQQLNPHHLRLIEMNQQRGCFESETPDPLWQPPCLENPFKGGLGDSAHQALAQGHRIGFIGGTDNHNGWPTLSTGRQQICGIAGVLSHELSAPSIHAALHARRCYATTGARIVARATLNDELIGSELSLEPDTERRFSISIHGTAPIERVEIISFNSVIHAFPVEADAC